MTKDRLGYIFYECKYKNKKDTKQVVDEEIKQVQDTGLQCYRYGFFSKSGFEEGLDSEIVTIGLDEVYQ